VKQIYDELHIVEVYQHYEEESYQRISELIEKVNENLLPKDMFYKFMNRIYKRQK